MDPVGRDDQLCLSQALSNTIWGFSKLGEEDTALLEAVAAASVPQLSQFNAQACVKLLAPQRSITVASAWICSDSTSDLVPDITCGKAAMD